MPNNPIWITILLLLLTAGCTNQAAKMEIRYTSLNDYDAHYVFNLKDSPAGLMHLYGYTLQDLKASKHYRDSIQASGHPYDARESLPLKAEPVVLYTPPNEWEGAPDSSHMIISFSTDEDSYRINGITVFACKQSHIQVKSLEKKNSGCTLQLNTASLNLCALRCMLQQTDTLKYQLGADNFTYSFVNSNSQKLLAIAYTEKGRYLELIFPEKQP
ncbi:hypothetical protein [Chitinophaga qingshengii]|uniref:Lipoprotein n=1 Tax=Chitinophaga qingshengii TaxID=1569794 RepID=A0ABR7TMH6_9BACT|nr:hypothetical protein [Chitinophaga qingshengii]MBC9931200.1 hypothetical protein [Chitinophaga qingshengii]